MRAFSGRTLSLRSPVLAAVAIVAMVAGLAVLPAVPASAAKACKSGGGNPKDEKKLKEAAAERQAIQKELNEILNTGELLAAEIEATAEERDELEKKRKAYEKEARTASAQVANRLRRNYMLSNSDPVLTMLSATDASDVVEQSRMLALLARGSAADFELAVSAERRTEAAAEAAARANERLKEMNKQHEEIEARKKRVLAEAKELESRLAAKVARQRAANGSGCPLPASQVSGGLACPVDQPRNYTDTWGAARSGGRSHMGVDILAPHGTAVRAYENGTITRMNNSSLGGISLYMVGDSSNNQYYYTHLSGYVSGVSVGDKVKAGQHIAYVGDTGNAAGIPHLHWEVRPGGGANVNPYPYAHAACG